VENAAVAAVFAEMSDLLSIVGGDPYRARAFRQTGRIIEQLRRPLAELFRDGRLDEIRGLGAGSIERIADILQTGTCADHQRLLHRVPRELRALLTVRGLGPRHVQLIHDRLGVTTLDQLEMAARSGLLAAVPGIGTLTVDTVLRDLDARRQAPPDRMILSDALALGALCVAWMLDDPHTIRAEQAGSARRRAETVGDLDILVLSTAPDVSSARFVAFPDVRQVLRRGEGRASVLVGENRVQIDLRLTSLSNWGAALHAMTGSQAHNVAMRVLAHRRRCAVSEHGVWERRVRGRGRGEENRRVARQLTSGATEVEVFAALSLPFIPPELREGAGELEAALAGRLPRLIELDSLVGEPGLRARTRADAIATGHAMARAGRRWALWVRSVDTVSSASDRRRFRHDAAMVSAATGLVVWPAVEVRLLDNGAVDERGAHADGFVVVADATPIPGHSRAAATARVTTAVHSGRVHGVTRVQGRVLPADPSGADVDLLAVLVACAHRRVYVEVSGEPDRPDLSAQGCRLATEVGALLALSARPREPADLERTRYALWQARRGWVTAASVLSTMSVEQVGRLWGVSSMPAPHTEFVSEESHHVDDVDAGAHAGHEALSAVPSEPEGLAAPHRRDELRQRLEAFLASGDDPELERLLETRGGHPLQAAFAMLAAFGASSTD
jgi:DNA polymerase (family 10)